MIGLLQPSLDNVCTLKVPEGYIQSQVHPAICYIPEGWNGYTHWLFSTPWGSNDEENPCLYYANKNADGTHPKVFTPHPNNPIVPKPDGVGEYNADPEIIFDPLGNGGLGRMYMFWKDTSVWEDDGLPKGGWRVIQSDNGMDWTNERIVKRDRKPSMAHARYKGVLRAYFFSAASNAFAHDSSILHHIESFVIDDLDNVDFRTGAQQGGCMLSNHMQPWHFTMFVYKDILYMIANAYDHLNSPGTKSFLYYSTDGINFKQYSRIPVCNYLTPYRPSAIIDEDGNLVLYQAVRNLPKPNEFTEDGKGICLYVEKMDNVLDMLKE